MLLKDWLGVFASKPRLVVIRSISLEAVWIEGLLSSGSLDDVEGDVLEVLVGDQASSGDFILLAVHSGLREGTEGFHDVLVLVLGSQSEVVFVLWSISIAADRVVSFMSAVNKLQFSVIVQVGEPSRSLEDLVSDWLSEVSHVPELDFLIIATIVSHSHEVFVVSQPDELW